jgi:[acyl-carrier-protein] S-malonyltransferase
LIIIQIWLISSSSSQTRFCQPAVVVTSLAAVEKLYQAEPKKVENCLALAGFSVGEITALIFSGAISFDDGIHLVKIRSEAMQYCSELAPSGMMSVFFGRDNRIGLATQAAKKWIEEKQGVQDPVCNVANYLYAGAKVIAGNNEVSSRLRLIIPRETRS